MTPEEIKQIDARWKSDMDRKVDSLLRAEEEHRNKYGAFLDILIKREADRTALRKAVIEKTLAGLIWMAVVGFVSLAWSGARQEISDIMNAVRGVK